MNTENMNIFELAARQKLRFDGQNHLGLNVEQLWDLPLQTTRANGSDLDGVGKILLRMLRTQDEESLVTPANNAVKNLLNLKLEVVKHIIATKQTENAAKADEAARASQRAQLRELLAEKHAEELKGLTKEEIEARLVALGG